MSEMATHTQEKQQRKQPVAPMTKEHKLIFDWRVQEFFNLGFNTEQAEKLAHTKIEVWAMRRLLRGGCDKQLAFRILRGTDTTGQEDGHYDWTLVL